MGYYLGEELTIIERPTQLIDSGPQLVPVQETIVQSPTADVIDYGPTLYPVQETITIRPTPVIDYGPAVSPVQETITVRPTPIIDNGPKLVPTTVQATSSPYSEPTSTTWLSTSTGGPTDPRSPGATIPNTDWPAEPMVPPPPERVWDLLPEFDQRRSAPGAPAQPDNSALWLAVGAAALLYLFSRGG